MRPGDVVYSKSGRDSGRYFAVVATEGEKFVRIADGDVRRIRNATLKNVRHLKATGDRLERCFVVPLSDNPTAASTESALNGRRVEGRYDAANNKLMVPEIYVSQEDWHFTGEHDEYEENTGYQTTVTNSGAWDQESPTQWYSVRITAQYLLYNAANSASMRLGNGDQLGAIVTVHYNDEITEDKEIKCKIGDVISEPDAPVINAASERFMGWYTDEEFTQPASFPMAVTKAVNLYPLVVPMTSCVQTYDLNYEGAPAPVSEYYETDTAVNLPAFVPVRPGYTFGLSRRASTRSMRATSIPSSSRRTGRSTPSGSR